MNHGQDIDGDGDDDDDDNMAVTENPSTSALDSLFSGRYQRKTLSPPLAATAGAIRKVKHTVPIQKESFPRSTSLSSSLPRIHRHLIIKLRRQYSIQHILSTELDYPSAFGNQLGTDLPAEEKIAEMCRSFRQHGLCIVRRAVDVKILQRDIVPLVCSLQQRVCDALERKEIAWRVQTDRKIEIDETVRSGMDTKQQNESLSSSIFRFREAASRCKGRMDVVLGDDLLETHINTFQRHILQNETIQDITRCLFGGDENFNLVYSGLIFNWPGSSTQPWHQDGQPLFPEIGNSAKIQASIPPYAVNVFIPLETRDGELERGPTEFVPGSHLWASNKELDQIRKLEDLDVQTRKEIGGNDSCSCKNKKNNNNNLGRPTVVAPILKQSDVLVYDYRICHRGTSNLSRIENDAPRRILYLMYARPWFQDHINFDYTKSARSLWD